MPFIGMIIEKNGEKQIRDIITKELKIGQDKIIKINEKTMENLKNITFETIVIAKELKNNNNLKKILKNTKYIIVNSDCQKTLKLLEDTLATVITYGFNPKATITASSITDENIMISIQRNIENIYGEEIENQEIRMKHRGNAEIEMASLAVQIIYKRQK